MFAAVEAFLTANSDCNGTSCSAGQQQPIFRGSVFSSEHKRTPRSLEWCWHKAQTISTCPPPAHTPHSCHHPRRLDVHSPPATPDHRLATTKQSSSTGTHRAAAFLRQGDEFPPSGPYLPACLLALKVVSSYSGLEISTPSKMMIRMMMTFITIIWSSNHQEHWLFRWSVFNCSPSKRSRRQPRVRKCPLINSKHRKHTLGVPTFKILLNWILLLLVYLIISPALMVWSWPEAYSEASIICYNFYLASSKSHRQKNN